MYLRRIIAILTVVLGASLGALGQGSATSSPGVVYVNVAPAGSCNAGALIRQLITGTGATYTCQSISGGVGTWTALGSGTATSVPWSGITAPTANLSIVNGSYTSTFTTTTGVSQFFAFKNSTAALVGASQSSPIISNCGTEWHASASTEGCLAMQFVPGTGTDAANSFNFTHTGSATGLTTTNFPGPVAAGAVGSNPGVIVLPGNTATLAVTANTAGWEAPNSASFTAYWLQLPTTGPSGTQVLQCGTPSSGISACSFANGSGGVTSFSGDSGGFISNSSSTGAVTATLATQAAKSMMVGPRFGSAASPTMVASPSPIYNHDPTAWVFIWDDFDCDPATLGGDFGCKQWLLSGTPGTPAVDVTPTATGNFYGAWKCTTGTVSTNNCVMIPGPSNGGTDTLSYNTATGDIYVRVACGSTTNVSCFVGLMNISNSSAGGETGTNAIGIGYDTSQGDTHSMCVTRAASTSTRTSLANTPDVNFHTYHIRLANGTIGCSIDGGTEVAQSTNVPSVKLSPNVNLITRTTSAEIFEIDYWWSAIGLSR
jgi:hypothetical protein